MFSVTQQDSEGFSKVILQNETHKVEIIPNCGGILNAWHVQMDGEWKNIIEGYENEEDFRANCEAKGFRSCKLSPYVCRLDKGLYSFNGVDYEIGKFKLGDNSIHGLMYDVPFEVVHQHADEQLATVQVETCYPGTDPGFPFQYTIMLEYILKADGLTLNTHVLNQHDEEIPMADGWHPYFTFGTLVDECQFQMATDSMLEFSDQLVPTGEVLVYDKFQTIEDFGDTFLDNSFVLQHPLSGPACMLIDAQKKWQLEIWPAASYPLLQIYTPPHRKSIAIENLSAAPDAFNNMIGLVYLQPNETKTFSTTYKIAPVS